jgi:tRNA A-37 threonylcarbamoyl transferase component Bud32
MLTNDRYERYKGSASFIMNINDKKCKKKIVDKHEFTNEINEQYNIYKKTLFYNNIPICPSIIYNTVLTGINQTNSYLFKLSNKLYNLYGNEHSTVTTVLNKLIDMYSKGSNQRRPKGMPLPDLGIIGMEFAKGYKTLDDYLNGLVYINLNTHIEEVKNDVLVLNNCETDCRIISAVVVNIIRLFISTGIIHEDLHTKNIMVQKELQKCLLIDFGIIDMITNYEPYKGEIVKNDYIFNEKPTQKVSVNALNKYLATQLGASYKYIGEGEQIFMQNYLYNIREKDARCKKILKLFLLIIISERQLSFIIRGLPVNFTGDFINTLGLQIRPTFKPGSNLSVKDSFIFDYESLNNDSVTFDDWINDAKNIKPSYKTFFKNIFFSVYETLNDYYKFQNFEQAVGEKAETVIVKPEAVVRIGLDPEESMKYRAEANKYEYHINKGGTSRSTFGKGGAKSRSTSTFKKRRAKSRSTSTFKQRYLRLRKEELKL